MTRGGSTRRVISLATAALLALTGLLVASPTPAGAAPAAAAAQGRRLVPSADLAPAASIHLWNANSFLCGAARTGSGERPVVQTTCDWTVGRTWADQYWQLVPTGDGSVHIRSSLLGLCIVARGSGETAVVATTCDTAVGASWDDQHWWEYQDTDGTTQLWNGASGLCLAARGLTESALIATTCDWAVGTGGAYWWDQHWYI